MTTAHLNEKRTALVEKREKLIDRFNQSARRRTNTARVCTEIRWVNDFIATLERIEAGDFPLAVLRTWNRCSAQANRLG